MIAFLAALHCGFMVFSLSTYESVVVSTLESKEIESCSHVRLIDFSVYLVRRLKMQYFWNNVFQLMVEMLCFFITKLFNHCPPAAMPSPASVFKLVCPPNC